jgi:hypothetical protein
VKKKKKNCWPHAESKRRKRRKKPLRHIVCCVWAVKSRCLAFGLYFYNILTFFSLGSCWIYVYSCIVSQSVSVDFIVCCVMCTGVWNALASPCWHSRLAQKSFPGSFLYYYIIYIYIQKEIKTPHSFILRNPWPSKFQWPLFILFFKRVVALLAI